MTTYHRGDTIRLKGSFYTFAGVLADLSAAPTVKIYDMEETLLVTATATKESTGVYYYDYTTTTDGDFVYEFSGTSESKTILRRASISIRFVS